MSTPDLAARIIEALMDAPNSMLLVSLADPMDSKYFIAEAEQLVRACLDAAAPQEKGFDAHLRLIDTWYREGVTAASNDGPNPYQAGSPATHWFMRGYQWLAANRRFHEIKTEPPSEAAIEAVRAPRQQEEHAHEWIDLPTLDVYPPIFVRQCESCGLIQECQAAVNHGNWRDVQRTASLEPPRAPLDPRVLADVESRIFYAVTCLEALGESARMFKRENASLRAEVERWRANSTK